MVITTDFDLKTLRDLRKYKPGQIYVSLDKNGNAEAYYLVIDSMNYVELGKDISTFIFGPNKTSDKKLTSAFLLPRGAKILLESAGDE